MRAKPTDKNRQDSTAESARAARLKAALKANIAKRKAQARARASGSDGASEDKAERG